MYWVDSDFGLHIFAETLGNVWIDLVEAVITEGKVCFDEQRKRRALDNVRLKATKPVSTDHIIATFGNQDNLRAMLDLTFKEPKMYDCDITPSFSCGANSYFQRIQERKLFDFVVKRLSAIPESKKAVIFFPVYDDYKQVIDNMNNDY